MWMNGLLIFPYMLVRVLVIYPILCRGIIFEVVFVTFIFTYTPDIYISIFNKTDVPKKQQKKNHLADYTIDI